MKITLIILTLSLFLAACSRQDARLSQQIIGTWQSKGTGTMSFNSDASFLVKERFSARTNDYAGTWQIKDTVMTLAVTNVSGPDPEVQAGDTIQFTNIHLDARHLSYKVRGQTVTFSR